MAIMNCVRYNLLQCQAITKIPAWSSSVSLSLAVMFPLFWDICRACDALSGTGVWKDRLTG